MPDLGVKKLDKMCLRGQGQSVKSEISHVKIKLTYASLKLFGLESLKLFNFVSFGRY